MGRDYSTAVFLSDTEASFDGKFFLQVTANFEGGTQVRMRTSGLTPT
jgi:hypothetical protein